MKVKEELYKLLKIMKNNISN